MTRMVFLPIFFLLMMSMSEQPAKAADGCDFSISNINFGSVTLLNGAAVDSSATLDIVCRNTLTIGLSMRVCPNIGAGSGGLNGSARQMIGPSGQALGFQLYQDAGRTIPWGSVDQPTIGAPPPIDFLSLPLTTTTVHVPIYARILASQQSAAGGAYLATFAGAQTRFSYASYLLFPQSCAAMTQNPTQVNFDVQANVNRTCDVTAQGINFGSHGLITSNVDAAGQLSVICTLTLPYSISLNGGLSNALPTQRKMTKGAEAIIYGLYKNNARNQPWGNGAGETVSGTGSGAQQDIPVYGRVAPQNTPSTGTYTDTVVVTVTY